MPNPRLASESEILAALQKYHVVGTPEEPVFNDITLLASQICETPISLIGFLDGGRFWLKSKVGIDVAEMPTEQAFCRRVDLEPGQTLVVRDTLQDERFADHPFVAQSPHVRSYAGTSLVNEEGVTLGSIGVFDTKVREYSRKQIMLLKILARQVVAQLEAQRNLHLLRESAQELDRERCETQLILDSVPSYIYFKDTKNNILRVNQAVTDSLGVACSEIEGRPTRDFYPELADGFYEDDLEVIRSKRPKLGIVERLSDEKEPMRWIRTDKIPIANTGGEVERVLVVATDITALKNTEASLLQSQALLQQANQELEARILAKAAELVASQRLYEDLYQNSPDMHVSVDAKSRVVLQCNDTLLRELGYERDEIVGYGIAKLYHPDSPHENVEVFQEFKQMGSVRNKELMLSHKDGSAILVSVNISAIRDEKGNIVASRSVCRDISEIKMLEEAATTSMNQLAHLSRVATMNEMATGIAHELNQPLYAITNYAQGALIRLKKQQFDSESLKGLLQDIAADADRAATLIKSFRSFVKPSERHVERVETRSIVMQLIALLSHELKQLGATLKVEIADDLPGIVCDLVQIKQVLVNLVLNAAEAAAEASSICREIRLVVEEVERGRLLQFSVIDRGPGLQDADLDRIFDAFYTTKKEGLGMGLPICRTIVEAHGGELLAKPTKGGGLTMSLHLPIREK